MPHPSPQLKYALLDEIVSGKGPIAFQRAVQNLRREAPEKDLRAVVTSLLDGEREAAGRACEAELQRKKMKFTTLFDADFPTALQHIPDPPVLLFYCGAVQNLHRPAIAIVGSRSCTTYGLQNTRRIAGELARMGFVVVSGLALGIDAQAHAACLEVEGRTVAVLGSGLDVLYPKAHLNLARKIIRRQGTVITEFPPGEVPRPFHFPVRNRIISGLCHATIIVEAKKKSGSLATARHCLDQGRELFAVPGPVHHETCQGTHRLIERGEAQIFVSLKSLLDSLEPLLGLAANQEKRVREKIRDPIARQVYGTLDAFESTAFDQLVVDLNLEASSVATALMHLEGLGLVVERPGQMYLRNPLIHSTQET